MQREGWPEPGDLVVCTVDQVLDFGAFVTLDEYVDKKGFIHISEVASGWIKYIRDHVREGQKIVCKVLNVDKSKHHIDLSLKDVNEHQRREKIQAWKADLKAWKWLQMAYEGREDDLKRVKDALMKSYNSLYGALEETAISGEESLSDSGLTEEDIKIISRLAKENVKIPMVEISGYVDLRSFAPDGIEIIKKALKQAKRIRDKDATLEIKYVGAPRYRIKVIAPDYKHAEAALKKSAQAAIKYMEQHGGEGAFVREA
ncbi:MAG: translation initiation factor IF-2 subunit alpha [Methanothrix sp.]|jgi:translation initiation factor 2 subunit alpha (aeIF-2a)|uniref:Translation initiation factor 2 subunit alpha n=1 Tax=Methanothrix thermoacetophila (strain DSM 6194 / JCM 14653 / NBRC 101360 / PT) TaxID=349307 RepID=A0B684_METTP|nr:MULTISPECIES: translation initiation factor IF-2 subunit alpha [Methanothrix]ABK14208.1 translation initiation factor 2 subunit alpha (aeIF-2a) [Methanothrix thermoacetophila PT]MBC7079693.1 translation initiation factor IF-2 subunit alpha [Methanothrix sp.]NPU87768.1 translation initiation factor IF-2 subunit alpha [Methanothrix sp.]